jgi:hypothetical protein
MSAIDDAAILKRAQEFCTQNGTRWDNLADDKRQRYLTRAREVLLEEQEHSRADDRIAGAGSRFHPVEYRKRGTS